MIEIRGLRFGYGGGGAPFLRLDAFELASGQSGLVVGPSGCGKTTLLHLIAGLLVPREGTIVVGGQDLGALAPAARDRFRGRTIGIVLQQFHLLPTLTAIQNLLVAQSIAGLPVDRAAAMASLAALGVADAAGAHPHQLSVGQQQRIAIARAMVNRPRLLLADEPTSNLDDESCEVVAGLLLDAARREGAALLIASHDSRLKARMPTQLALARRETRAAA